MAPESYHVAMFKALSYLYACIEAGVEPSAAKAEEVTGINPVFYRSVIGDMADCGYVRADLKGMGSYSGLSITAKGVKFLRDDADMADVRSYLGSACSSLIDRAVGATREL